MLLQHHKFLARDEALESGIPLIRVGENLWVDSNPLDILRLWEKRLHKDLVPADLDVGKTVSESSISAELSALLVLVHSVDGLVDVNELNKGIHRLGSNAFHDDGNWLIDIWDGASVAAEEGKNLLRGAREWNLSS